MSTEGLIKSLTPSRLEDAAPWSRADRRALAALIVALLIGLPLLAHPWYDASADASLYIETARSMLAGEGYSYLGMPFHIRPPGFSLLISPILAARGLDFHALNLFGVFIGALAVVLLFCFGRPRLGWMLSLAVCAVVWLNPAYETFCNTVMSDVPGLAAMLGVLLCERWSRGQRSIGREGVLGLAIGLASYIRTIAVLLLPAILLARVVQRLFPSAASPDRGDEPQPWSAFFVQQLLPVSLAVVLVMLPWSFRNDRVADTALTDQLMNHSYSTGLLRQDKGDPTSPFITPTQLGQRVAKQAGRMAAALASRAQSWELTPVRAAGAIALLLLFAVSLLTRRDPAAFFTLAALGAIVIYFGFLLRLIVPVAVLLLVQAAEAATHIVTPRLGQRRAALLVSCLLVALALIDFAPRRRWPEIREAHEAMLQLAEQVRAELPADARLATGVGFNYTLYLGRPVYSLLWSDRRGEGMRGVEHVVGEYGIDLILLDVTRKGHRQVYDIVAPDYGPGRQLGPLRVISVRDRPSIFLITVDTLRADHLGAYGYRFDTSPNLDRFAADGMLFERCFSHAPTTRVSFASMLTGFLPHETQKIKNVPLPPTVESIAETLTAAGYTSLAVVGNWVLRQSGGWDQGFAIYDEQMDDHEANRGWPERSASDLTDRALELMDAHAGEPLFMWIHYEDPHGPYTPPAGYAERYWDPEEAPRTLRLNPKRSGKGGIPSNQKLGSSREYRHYRASYDGEISYMDEHFGRLVEHLKSTGAYDDSLIIFTSDHGEAMGERDYFFSHVGRLYSHNTHVPMILRQGDALKGRRRDYCQHIDIVPTALGFAGLEIDARLRGRDLRRSELEDIDIVAAAKSPIDKDGDRRSIIEGGFKLIWNQASGHLELYSMEEDPAEQNDLAQREDMQEEVARLARRLATILEDDRLGVTAEAGRELDEEDLERLRSLGYVE